MTQYHPADVSPLPDQLPRLLAITGPSGSGKDCFAQVLIEAGYVKVNLATPLEQMLGVFLASTGLSREQIRALIQGPLKDTPCPELGGRTPRDVISRFGAPFGLSSDLIASSWVRRVKAHLQSGQHVLCTDVARLTQAARARELGAAIIRVSRPAIGVAKDNPTENEPLLIEPDIIVRNAASLPELREKAVSYLRH